MPGKSSRVAYDPHPSIKMVQNVVAAMRAKTGRTLEEWVAYLKKNGPTAEPDQREWLKAQGLGTNYAWWISERTNGRGDEDIDPKAYLRAAAGYIEAMYAGGKAALRPLHDALFELGRSIGPDVKISPCKTMVPLFREHVFAQIKPASQKRIDFGFALGGAKGKGRLEETGGFAKKDRITHRIAITCMEDIDDEVRHWLRIAYELDAPKAGTGGASKTLFNIKKRATPGEAKKNVARKASREPRVRTSPAGNRKARTTAIMKKK